MPKMYADLDWEELKHFIISAVQKYASWKDCKHTLLTLSFIKEPSPQGSFFCVFLIIVMGRKVNNELQKLLLKTLPRKDTRCTFNATSKPPLHAFPTPFQNKIQEKMPLKRKKLEFLNVPFKPFSYICPRFSKSSTFFGTSDALWNTKMPRQPTPSQRVYVWSYPVLDRSLRGGKKGTRTTVRIKETDFICPPVGGTRVAIYWKAFTKALVLDVQKLRNFQIKSMNTATVDAHGMFLWASPS